MITNEELIAKARQANSSEELLTLAKENDYPLDEEGAKAYFEQLHKSGELSDDELDNVAGGGCYKGDRLVVTVCYYCDKWKCKKCGGGITHLSRFLSCHYCANGRKNEFHYCSECEYCSYEKALWLCNHPENRK